jgi:hypothetical protein
LVREDGVTTSGWYLLGVQHRPHSGTW